MKGFSYGFVPLLLMLLSFLNLVFQTLNAAYFFINSAIAIIITVCFFRRHARSL